MMRRPPAPRGGRRVDLHAHTLFSDGVLAPRALVERARDLGLAAIAITDHDVLDGIPEARDGAGPTLEVVPGIEVSSTRSGEDFHVLGYYLDSEHPALRARLARFHEDRRLRVRAIVDRLREAGLEVSPDDVFAIAGAGVVGRPHVAEAMLRAGHVESLDDAFRRFLGPRGAAFVARPAFAPEEAIDLIHQAGGVSVLAHPGARLGDATLEGLVAHGLRGIEAWHPQHSPATVRRYRALADRFGLLVTGGSDFHGPGRGVELGDLPVPVSVLDALKRAAGVAG